MKKNTVLLSLSLISCLIFTTGAWASSGPTLKNFKGDVQVLKQGSTTWTAVQEGMALGKGDRIKTGEKSKADIVLGQGTITLNEATEFGIKEYSEEGDQIKSTGELALGKLRAKVEKLQAGSTFEIRTPTAVAAVRGTLVDLWVYLLNGIYFTQLDVKDGVVNLKDIQSGDGTDVPKDESATVPSKEEDFGEEEQGPIEDGFQEPEGFDQEPFGSQDADEKPKEAEPDDNNRLPSNNNS